MKAVVIFNLGGPDKLDNVKPFLFNLFNDPAILSIPQPFRYLLAKLVSSRRNKKAQGIYSYLGGRSPIYPETQNQADALQKKLGSSYKVFICMRYWHPMMEDVIEDVLASNPEEIILLPLYPHYSFSTTGSFFEAWKNCMREKKIDVPVKKICCYPHENNFIQSCREVISKTVKECSIPPQARFLFSAHGLPQKNIINGDPYEEQIHITVNHILKDFPSIQDHVICFQSKVGPLKWLEPSTEQEIKRASEDGVPVVIVPISFVSENSETLYELDYEYKTYAESLGINQYYRIPTLGYNTHYIESLASMVLSDYKALCGADRCQKIFLQQKAA
ncbi:MAG: ferrochelatase [Alphaproteobacteria bacterium]|nr:ferrochelatase [Alphaproteobacteria bacterium]